MGQADPATGDPPTGDPNGGKGATTIPELRERGGRLADFGAAAGRRPQGASAGRGLRESGLEQF